MSPLGFTLVLAAVSPNLISDYYYFDYIFYGVFTQNLFHKLIYLIIWWILLSELQNAFSTCGPSGNQTFTIW